MAGVDLISSERDLRPYFKEQVEIAVHHQSLDVTQVSQFYLVNMLSQFAKTEKLFQDEGDHFEETPLAILLSRALGSETPANIKAFKRLGDTSLYIAGYFSDHIDSRHVDMDYYISMGEGAYQNLSGLLSSEKTFSELYEELSENFVGFVCVLSEIRNSCAIATNTGLLRLYERWLKTGDSQIKQKLIKEGIIKEDDDRDIA